MSEKTGERPVIKGFFFQFVTASVAPFQLPLAVLLPALPLGALTAPGQLCRWVDKSVWGKEGGKSRF